MAEYQLVWLGRAERYWEGWTWERECRGNKRLCGYICTSGWRVDKIMAYDCERSWWGSICNCISAIMGMSRLRGTLFVLNLIDATIGYDCKAVIFAYELISKYPIVMRNDPSLWIEEVEPELLGLFSAIKFKPSPLHFQNPQFRDNSNHFESSAPRPKTPQIQPPTWVSCAAWVPFTLNNSWQRPDASKQPIKRERSSARNPHSLY